MKKIIEKHENLVCYLLIAIYVVVNSYCMQNFGLTDYRSAIINMVFSIKFPLSFWNKFLLLSHLMLVILIACLKIA